MNKIFLGIMLLFLFSVSSCLNEENDVMGPNNLNQVDTRLSVSEAEDVLRSFVVGTDTKSNTSFRIKSHTVKNVYIENAQNLQVTVSDTIPVYEFLTETDGQEGYSVVVGDKRIEKVIVSVPHGSFNDTLFIDPLRLYFRDIPMMLQQDMQQYYEGTQELATQTKSSVQTCYKFLPTSWGQGHPYNNQCPVYCSDNAPAGCVAIAVAQVLAYHRVPSSLSWNSILASNKVTTSSSSAVINQVSSLIAEIGSRVNMQYDCFGSSASINNVPSALASYGLTTGGVGGFNVGNCINSLQNWGPVIVRANESGASVGHEWVCDAWKRHIYDDGTYYDYLNMNWGWDGDSNGFYLVEDPVSFSAEGFLFNSNFRMVLDIRK